ncbi:hypothetical protein GGI07_001124 [Coemansia sp. Benny D115]|nr:hypothetical protein GGI07_001124 [Coemansia sp. Benny D115]
MKPQIAFATLLALFSTLCQADIVLSVAQASNMDSYLAVLSNAWPTLYPKLDNQLQIAHEQVPTEYDYLMQLLSITAVPTTYDEAWARAFIGNAQNIGPTTILADAIPGAATPEVQQVVSTEDGIVATAEVTPARPTIVVAINGNIARQAHNADDSSSDNDVSPTSSSEQQSSSSSSSSSDSQSAASTLWCSSQVAMSMIVGAAAFALSSLF